MSALRRRKRLNGLAVVVLGLMLVGCSQPVPTEAEIVGTWVGESPDGWGEPGVTMVFDADGTFTAHGVPEGLLAGSREDTAIDGEGAWTIRDGSSGNSLGSVGPGVRTEYSPYPGATRISVLVLSRSQGVLRLTYLNDPDTLESFILVKDA